MDGQIERCARCGTPRTSGRFCTTCGAELGSGPGDQGAGRWPGDTVERARETVPAYASASAPGPAAGTVPPLAPSAELPAYLAPERVARPGVGPGVWVGLVTAMVLVLLLGAFLLLHGGGSSPTAAPAPASSSTRGDSPSPSAGASTSSATPSPSPTTRVVGPPTNVAGFAQVSAPGYAPAAVDFNGDPVTYVPANLVDGRTDTCWRTPGDATGTVLTFRLDQPTRISRVGLVNGYDKIAYSGGRPYDWYLGNRRVLSVQWVFDDGTVVPQQLGTDRAMQQLAVPPVTTRTVRLRITAVSPPGHGRAARNDTAISEVLLLGQTA